ncbi:MAG: hypothetical protein P8L85_07970 [Rubripirellula sp.]|nr:hypothetical protein [Rubripirellula sp.]
MRSLSSLRGADPRLHLPPVRKAVRDSICTASVLHPNVPAGREASEGMIVATDAQENLRSLQRTVHIETIRRHMLLHQMQSLRETKTGCSEISAPGFLRSVTSVAAPPYATFGPPLLA